MGALTLLVGGQKAGKSNLALRLARRSGTPTLVTPAQSQDPELAERIARHREDRPADIQVIEGFDLAEALASTTADTPVIIDAIDTWLLHRMEAHGLIPDEAASVAPLGPTGQAAQSAVLAEIDGLLEAIAGRSGPTFIVAGAVGMGLHGPTPLARRYEDLHGMATQRLGLAATAAFLVVAGRALPLIHPDDLPEAR